MSKVAIKIEGVSKKYTVGKQKDGSLRGTLGSLLKSAASKGDDFWALRDISFEVNQGDVIGIIGKNGAGKSTLLKILSKITKPTEGRIEINGRVASLLEVGTGFHPELTGRENIYLNGTILGMTRKEVKVKFDEIVEFSGIEKFIDTPVKHYSSGMYVRLAFAVAAHLEPEILIIDEVLAVGDAEFQKKCLGKMKDVSNSGRTVLFVSHNLGAVKQLCNKGVLIANGELKKTGDVESIINEYLRTGTQSNKYTASDINKDVYISEAKVLNDKGNDIVEFHSDQSIKFKFSIKQKIEIDNTFLLLVRVLDSDQQVIFSCETSLLDKKDDYLLEIPENLLTKGSYHLDCIIYKPAVAQYDHVNECCEFTIINNNSKFAHLETFNIGKIYANHSWS